MPLDVILHMTVEVFFSASLIFLSAEVPDKAHICIHFGAHQVMGPNCRIPIAPVGTHAGLQSVLMRRSVGPRPGCRGGNSAYLAIICHHMSYPGK